MVLGSSESAWGTQVADLPPSLGEYVGFGNETSSKSTRRAVRYVEQAAKMGTDELTGAAYWENVEG